MVAVKMVYVIMDGQGNYVAPKEADQGHWYYLTYTGDCTGFTYYTNQKTAMHELDALNSLGNQFVLRYIDLKTIPKGKRVKQYESKVKHYDMPVFA